MGESFARNADAIFMETSAKDGSNVHDLFRRIGKLYLHVSTCVLFVHTHTSAAAAVNKGSFRAVQATNY